MGYSLQLPYALEYKLISPWGIPFMISYHWSIYKQIAYSLQLEYKPMGPVGVFPSANSGVASLMPRPSTGLIKNKGLGGGCCHGNVSCLEDIYALQWKPFWQTWTGLWELALTDSSTENLASFPHFLPSYMLATQTSQG